MYYIYEYEIAATLEYSQPSVKLLNVYDCPMLIFPYNCSVTISILLAWCLPHTSTYSIRMQHLPNKYCNQINKAPYNFLFNHINYQISKIKPRYAIK